jgi:hypothetical protein
LAYFYACVIGYLPIKSERVKADIVYWKDNRNTLQIPKSYDNLKHLVLHFRIQWMYL